MTSAFWVLLVLGIALAVAYAIWWYHTREEPVSGRGWAAGLRAASLTLILLLLLNPSWPAPADRGTGEDAVFLDASYSMSSSASVGGGSVWESALDEVGDQEAVWIFGGAAPRYLSRDSLPPEPIFHDSRLVPVLRSAARRGDRRVRILTDGEISDAAVAVAEARRLGLDVEIETLGGRYAERGISDIDAPGWARAGDRIAVDAEIVAFDWEEDSLIVEVVDETGRVLNTVTTAVPAPGRFSTARLSFTIEGTSGHRRYGIRFQETGGDPEPRDDERAFYIRVAERPAGPVLISLRPDWEPSFLLPNLDRLSDAPAELYLWLTDGPVSVRDDYRSVELGTMLRRARTAPLLVVHGYAADSPQWVRNLVRRVDRLLILPGGAAAFELPGWGVRVSSAADAEWYLSEQLPPSPLAVELGEFPAEQLPPLLRVRRIEGPGAWHPVELRRLRRGELRPAVVGGRAGGRRWAVASAEGYWRWGFRTGPGRELYRSLWTGLAAWLMEGEEGSGGQINPRETVVARGEALRWRLPAGFDSVEVEVEMEDGSSVQRTAAEPGDSVMLRLPVGRHRYVARGFSGDRLASTTSGPVEVESFSPELLPARETLREELAGLGVEAAPTGSEGLRREFATLFWPYLLLIGLFCSEWAVRRYTGLR